VDQRRRQPLSLGVQQRVHTNGISLSCWTAGDPGNPAVLLLHGFPECAHSWTRQVPALVQAGWFCIVPDLRGYASSDKPAEVSSYSVSTLVADVLGLADHFGCARVHLVSHDWGGILGWHTALDHADRVASFTAMNIPHPSVMARHLRTFGQLRKSWYIFAFQLPWLPERMLTVDRLTRVMFANTTTKPFTEEEVARYREAWSTPGAAAGMLGWYRAALRYPVAPKNKRVTRPTLIVFGQRDLALDWQMAGMSAERCDDVVLRLLPDAGHFVQHDAAEEVNRLLLDFLGRHREEPGTLASAR
jgi:epoxide hydrolase 4